MCYWEENISKQIEIPFLLVVLLLIPFKKLPSINSGSGEAVSKAPKKWGIEKGGVVVVVVVVVL